MDKQELVHRLKTSGLLHRYDQDTKLWQEAFNLYNATHGLKARDAMTHNCNTCVNKVYEWLIA